MGVKDVGAWEWAEALQWWIIQGRDQPHTDFASPNSNYNEEERNENGSQGQDKRSANVKGAI